MSMNYLVIRLHSGEHGMQNNQTIIHLGNWDLHCKKTSIGCITWLTNNK